MDNEGQCTVSFSPSGLPLEYVSHDICCDLSVACVFASSGLKGNGQPGLFMCWSMLGSSQCPPLPEAQRLPVEPRVAPPAAVSFPFPVFFKCYDWLEPNSRQANKLMTQTWAHSEHTVQPGNLTLLPIHRTLIWLVWGVKAREDKKGVRVVLRGHVGKIW